VTRTIWERTTPYGLLKAAWPEPQDIYAANGVEPVARVLMQDPRPRITLDGVEITRKRADQIIRAMVPKAEEKP
jgi:hypothetical protein